jgi:hypothetical protein
MITAVTSAYKMVSKHGFADIMQNGVTGERSLHAAAFFDAGDIVTEFTADKILDAPTYLTVQTAEHKHITLLPDFLQYVNHSCSPNVFSIHRAWNLLGSKKYNRAMNSCSSILPANGKWNRHLIASAEHRNVYTTSRAPLFYQTKKRCVTGSQILSKNNC